MATPEILNAPKAFTLAELNKVITQKEELLGPLIAIGNDGNKTLLTFDTDLNPPAKHAVVARIVGTSQPVVAVGFTMVSRGKVFIESTLTKALATRPN
jgi:hypothetical protein